MKTNLWRRLPLIGRIVLAMILGIGAAQLLPLWAARTVMTFSALFSQFLGFVIPLLILAYVATAIADVGTGAGRMLAATAAIAYAMTVGSGAMALGVSNWAFPQLITPRALQRDALAGADVAPWFTVEMPSLMGVMTALVLAFILGLGMAHSGSEGLHRGFDELRRIVTLTITGVIIPLLPLYIFAIFMNMAMAGVVATVLMTFLSIIAVIFVMHVVLLLVQYAIAGAVARRNPLPLLRTMLPAYFTALGTQSSAATIPVTLRQSILTGVRPAVAGFVIPLCATIHMSGSALKITSCAIALMIMQAMAVDPTAVMGFVAMLAITIIAAPGVPGGAIMASLGLLSSMLGFTDADCALMIALYIAMDSFGTACNVTGDGAIALIINKMFPER
jgi:Na+/H+-dicarboxylate symporter